MVDFLKFRFNKQNIEWSCSLSLQPSLLPNFIQILIMLGKKKKKNLGWSQGFLKGKKIINF